MIDFYMFQCSRDDAMNKFGQLKTDYAMIRFDDGEKLYFETSGEIDEFEIWSKREYGHLKNHVTHGNA